MVNVKFYVKYENEISCMHACTNFSGKKMVNVKFYIKYENELPCMYAGVN